MAAIPSPLSRSERIRSRGEERAKAKLVRGFGLGGYFASLTPLTPTLSPREREFWL